MLREMGRESVADFFRGIPDHLQLKQPLKIPAAQSETETLAYFRALAESNSTRVTGERTSSFLGAGAYDHFIPTIIDTLISRSEFYTSYTPYQPEISQGTLAAIFEYQTLICELTGMEVSNASLYDGSTATAEAVLMAERVTNRTKVVLAGNLHPEYRQVVDTYIRNAGISQETLPYDEKTGTLQTEAIGNDVAAVVVQSPNFFGGIEDLQKLGEAAHKAGALLVVVVAEGLSLGALQAPGRARRPVVDQPVVGQMRVEQAMDSPMCCLLANEVLHFIGITVLVFEWQGLEAVADRINKKLLSDRKAHGQCVEKCRGEGVATAPVALQRRFKVNQQSAHDKVVHGGRSGAKGAGTLAYRIGAYRAIRVWYCQVPPRYAGCAWTLFPIPNPSTRSAVRHRPSTDSDCWPEWPWR